MDPALIDFLKVAGGGGSLALVFFVMYVIGTRMVKSLDKVADKLDSGMLASTERHGEIKAELASLRGDLRGFERALTPVEGTPVIDNNDITDTAKDCPVDRCVGYLGHPGKHGLSAPRPRR